MSFIEIKNLKKIYNANKSIEVEALKSINLIIEKGDFCSIVGVSGSGKSTLLYILGCIDKQTEGTYLLEGKNVSKMSENELAQIRNKKIGFVLQDFGLIEEETVIENVRVPILFCKDKNLIRNFRNKAEKLLKDLGIENLKDKKVNLLSGGQRQRVAIARALINDPELILADEPTGSLDTNTAQNIMNIFKELNKSGKTIIIVTHNMELAKYYLMQMKRLYHCRTFASHSHLPLMLDDRVPEERETAMQIGALMLDLCEVLIICGSCISEGMRREIQTAFEKGKDVYWYDSKMKPGELMKVENWRSIDDEVQIYT